MAFPVDRDLPNSRVQNFKALLAVSIVLEDVFCSKCGVKTGRSCQPPADHVCHSCSWKLAFGHPIKRVAEAIRDRSERARGLAGDLEEARR